MPSNKNRKKLSQSQKMKLKKIWDTFRNEDINAYSYNCKCCGAIRYHYTNELGDICPECIKREEEEEECWK